MIEGMVPRLGSITGAGAVGEGVGEPVGLGAGFDDVGAEGEPVDDGGATTVGL